MPQAHDDDKRNCDPRPQSPGATPGEQETFKLTEATIAFNYDSDKIKVGPGPNSLGWDGAYDCIVGACDTVLHRLTHEERIARVLSYFADLVANHGVDVQAAHREFDKIDEYREGLSRLSPWWRLTDAEPS